MSERMVIFTDRLSGKPQYYASNQYTFVGASTTQIRIWGNKHDVTEDIERMLSEARRDEARKDCEAICSICGEDSVYYKPAELRNGKWIHPWKEKTGWTRCTAGPIHERLQRESQKGGNHAKTET